MEAVDYRAIYGPAALFDGEILDATAVVVKYTVAGDADFDGKISSPCKRTTAKHFDRLRPMTPAAGQHVRIVHSIS